MKPDKIEFLVYEIEQAFNAGATGLWDNSHNELTYSEYKVKLQLYSSWSYIKVQYMPFVYKGYPIWISCKDTVTRLPSLILKQGRLL